MAAHEKGVVHRDLKPENIMLLRDPEDPSREDVKVLDFGIAKILEVDSPSLEGSGGPHSMLTGVGTVVGTPAYMSPEQCRGEPVDIRSDVYTCGILLHQLVTGRLPFSAPNAMDLAVMHVRAPPPPLAEVAPGVHPALAALVQTALSKWPQQRQQTAAELRDKLRAILPELSATPLEVVPVAPGHESVVMGGTAKAQASPVVDEASTSPTNPAPPMPPAPEQAPRASVPDAAAALKRVPNPTSAPMARRSHPSGSSFGKARRAALTSWLLVPLALVVGVAFGVLAFLVSRR